MLKLVITDYAALCRANVISRECSWNQQSYKSRWRQLRDVVELSRRPVEWPGYARTV